MTHRDNQRLEGAVLDMLDTHTDTDCSGKREWYAWLPFPD